MITFNCITKPILSALLAALTLLPVFGQQPHPLVPEVPAEEALRHHVYRLADDSMRGRGAGSRAGLKSAEYIARCFSEAGLEPLADNSFMQYFWRSGLSGARYQNVAGILKGSDPGFEQEAVVIGAHYDHLGALVNPLTGRGPVYNGAEDNASGVAVLIELARRFAYESEAPRNIIFIAFDGEEEGLYGSRHMVKYTSLLRDFNVKVMLNLDMVGGLAAAGKLTLRGAAMPPDWESTIPSVENYGLSTVMRRAGRVSWRGSDHGAFAAAGVPALLFTTGKQPSYHKTSDTAEKLDYEGMALILEYVAEIAAYYAAAPR